MKSAKCGMGVLLAVVVGSVMVLAGFKHAVTVYQDDFSTLQSSAAAQYHNLSPSGQRLAGWRLFSGGKVLQATNSTLAGASVTYQVQNAKSITVGIFNYPGIMAGKARERQWVQGSYYSKGSEVRPEAQVKYSPGEDCIYLFAGGQYHRAIFDGAQFVFEAVEQAPTDIVPFGVSVSYSMDGVRYQGAALDYLRGEGMALLYYEELATAIPAGASHIRVSITSVNRVLDEGGFRWNNNPNLTTLLGKIEITGENMWFGVPEVSQDPPKVDLPPPVSSEAVSTEETEKKKPVAKVPNELAGATEKAPSSATAREKTIEKDSPAGSPKFEGSVAEAPKSATAKASSKKATGTTKSAKGSSSTATPEASASTEAPEAPLVYEVGRQEEKADPFTRGVLFYILGVAGVVLFILLRPKKEKDKP